MEAGAQPEYSDVTTSDYLAVQMLLLASFLMVWALFWSPAGAADLCDGKAPLIKHGYLEPTEEGEGIDLFADLMMG